MVRVREGELCPLVGILEGFIYCSGDCPNGLGTDYESGVFYSTVSIFRS